MVSLQTQDDRLAARRRCNARQFGWVLLLQAISLQALAGEPRVYRCERAGQSTLFAFAPCDDQAGPGSQLGRGVIQAPIATRLHRPDEPEEQPSASPGSAIRPSEQSKSPP